MKNVNTIIDDVVENAKAAASAVSKQAAKIYDASKHRISAETIKRAIGKKLIELGKLTYKATTQNEDLAEEIAKVVQEITELKQNLAIVKEHIASIKNQKICPECENKVTKVSSFCNICGHKFEDEPEEEIAEPEVVEAEPVEEVKEKTDEIVAAAEEAVEEIAVDAKESVEKADAEEAAE